MTFWIVDGTTDNLGSWARDGTSSEYGFECIPEIMLCYDVAPLIKVLDSIVNPAQIQHLARVRKDGDFRRRRCPGGMPQNLLLVDQDRKRETKLFCVSFDLSGTQGRIGLNAVEGNAALCVLLAKTIHFGNVAIAQRAIDGLEEQHDGALAGPFALAVLDSVDISERKPQFGTRDGAREGYEKQPQSIDSSSFRHKHCPQ